MRTKVTLFETEKRKLLCLSSKKVLKDVGGKL